MKHAFHILKKALKMGLLDIWKEEEKAKKVPNWEKAENPKHQLGPKFDTKILKKVYLCSAKMAPKRWYSF